MTEPREFNLFYETEPRIGPNQLRTLGRWLVLAAVPITATLGVGVAIAVGALALAVNAPTADSTRQNDPMPRRLWLLGAALLAASAGAALAVGNPAASHHHLRLNATTILLGAFWFSLLLIADYRHRGRPRDQRD